MFKSIEPEGSRDWTRAHQPDFITNRHRGEHWGDAELRGGAARRSGGVKIDKKPKENCVAQAECSGSALGHIAWVEGVSEDGKKVAVEEYNYT